MIQLVAPDADDSMDNPTWQTLKPQTMVDHAVAAIISGAARGVILPGDRIIEVELSRALNMSRVPIREALRILGSQGIVTSVPYRGIRLVEFTQKRLEQVLDVRVSLETLAARRAIEAGANNQAGLLVLTQARSKLATLADAGDAYGFALADADFHRTLVRMSGNPVLGALWESLGRQVTIIVGLSTLGKSMQSIVQEHDLLIEVFASGDIARMESELHDHIVVLAKSIDFDAIIAERRRRRQNS